MSQSDQGRLELWNEALREALDIVYTGLDLDWRNLSVGDIQQRLHALQNHLTKLRNTPGYPVPLARTRSLELLVRRHYEHMDDNSEAALKFTEGLVSMAFSLGHITDAEAELYMHRIKLCPTLHVISEDYGGQVTDHTGRVWCAYCGTITLCTVCHHEIKSDSMHSVKRGTVWLCSLGCRARYLEHPALVPAICRYCHRKYDYPADDTAQEYQRRGFCSAHCVQLTRQRMITAEQSV